MKKKEEFNLRKIDLRNMKPLSYIQMMSSSGSESGGNTGGSAGDNGSKSDSGSRSGSGSGSKSDSGSDSGSGSEWGSSNGTSYDECMPESVYNDLVNAGVNVANVWVCGLGFVVGLDEVTIYGSANTGSRSTCPQCGTLLNDWDECPNGCHKKKDPEEDKDKPDKPDNPDNPDKNETPGGGGGGGNGGAGGSPTIRLINISKTRRLTPEAMKELNKALDNLLKQCGYKSMYDNIKAKGGKIETISIDPTLKNPAVYDAKTNTLKFRSIDDIEGSFAEEFIHFFQNNHYDRGISQYYDMRGHTNVEFEAKLIQDIATSMSEEGGGAIYAFNADSQYGNDYEKWLRLITQEGTKIPSYLDLVETKSPTYQFNYWNFMKEFPKGKPQYPNKIKDDMVPRAINFINNSCNGK